MKKKFLFISAGLLLLGGTAGAEEPRWTDTLQRVSPAVVSIRVDAVRAFDTAPNSSTQATGFVVDAAQGLILTNRHVVQPGPVVAEAIFENREEVELIPIYRDPVHDFGFFRYNPDDLKYMTPEALVLAPERARIGREIRVIGNDAGEQRSILAGTLARLDRPAPFYGFGNYNDFNTFYLQAASSVSGGSSGSPVVDIEGEVLALNAGGNQRAASSFFLPLERVVRALELIREGRPVSRGGLLATFRYQPYYELRRLGLRPEIETQVRSLDRDAIGMLVVSAVLPGGPADKQLQPGDILLKADGRWMTRFEDLGALFDQRVGESVALSIERGGKPLQLTLPVADLHAVTPGRYLSFGAAVVNNLSYQQARQLNKPLHGVYVAEPGYILGTAAIPKGSVLISMDGQPVSSVDELAEILAQRPDGAQAVIRYYTFSDPKTEQVAVMTMDRRWFPVEICRRDDNLGHWPCEVVPGGEGEPDPQGGTAHFERHKDPKADSLARSLAYVTFDIPYRLDGVNGAHFMGTGLVVDAETGLVVVDRNTVPVAMGDVHLTFAGTVEIPGRVVFMHPIHNLAFIQYDPKLLGDTPVKSANLSSEPFAAGDPVWLVGLEENQRLLVHKAHVAAIDPLQIPFSRAPMFRESNLEAISLNNPPFTVGGVLTGEEGSVRALWASFSYGQGHDFTQLNAGIPAALLVDLVDQWRCCRHLEVRSLEVELALLPLSKARKLELPEQWVRHMQRDGSRRQVVMVARRVAGTPAESLLQEGDMIVAIEGEPVHNFQDVERLADRESVRVTLIREGRELTFTVPTVSHSGLGTERIVQWAGALLQAPHRAVAAQRGIAAEGVFVSFVWSGSPASRYWLPPLHRIVALDDREVVDLDGFLRLAAEGGGKDSIRLKVANLFGRESVITLKPDNRYWPTREIFRTEEGWQRIERPLQ